MYRCKLYDGERLVNDAMYLTEELGREWAAQYHLKGLVSKDYVLKMEKVVEHPSDLRAKEYTSNGINSDKFIELLMNDDQVAIAEFRLKKREIDLKYPMRRQ